LLAAAMAFLTGSASAQMPGMDTPLQKEQKRLTPEEQKKQEELDRNYRAASKKVPDQKPRDPWADIRPAPAEPPSKKKGP